MTQVYWNEEWKMLDNASLADDEVYAISNYGRIKSFKLRPEGVLINGSHLKGYKILNVRLKNNSRTTKYVHKLVAQLFLEREDGLQEFVIHLDYDKSNNHVSNLRWVTKSTMFEHHRLNPNYKKGRITYSKLTETQVIRLKKKLKRGKTKLYKIAREFGITHTQLNRIRSGENWGHVKIDEDE